jgi:hypothetical protein
MNNFERKLCQQTFRPPPPELRDALFGCAEVPANVIKPSPGTWRDWFWPSPQAWAGLAAIWIAFAVLVMADRDKSATPPSLSTTQISVSPTLLSYHTHHDLDHVLELAN